MGIRCESVVRMFLTGRRVQTLTLPEFVEGCIQKRSRGGSGVRLRTVAAGGGCALGPFPVYRPRSPPLCVPVSCDVSHLPGNCLVRLVILCAVTGKVLANHVSSFPVCGVLYRT